MSTADELKPTHFCDVCKQPIDRTKVFLAQPYFVVLFNALSIANEPESIYVWHLRVRHVHELLLRREDASVKQHSNIASIVRYVHGSLFYVSRRQSPVDREATEEESDRIFQVL